MAQEESTSLREKYQQLSEDFQFNLALLEERDGELERYDAIIAKALTVDSKRQEELSHLCSQVTQLEQQLSKSQREAAQYQLQLDDLKRSTAGEIQKQTKEYERTKSSLESRVQELEHELNVQRREMTATSESELRQREHEFNLKHDEMRARLLSHSLKVKMLSEKTEQCQLAYRQATEALKASSERCLQIQAQLHDRNHEVKILTAVNENRIKELEDELKKMKSKLKEDQDHHVHNLDRCIREVSTEIVLRDTKMIGLQEREARLRTELERSKETIDRYKQQLSNGLKRERALEQMQVQKELEWQRRCEDIKAKHYLDTEQLIQDLTQARDQAEAELKEKKRELQDLTVLVRSVQAERDQAVQDSTSKANCSSEEMQRLKEQNSVLRAAVAQMRQDMESLSHLPQASRHPGPGADPTPQLTSGPPDHTTNSVSEVSPAGNVSKKESNPSGLEVEVRPRESAAIPIMEQNALVQQLLLENLRLHHQVSERLSGSLCKKINHPESRSRSKQAALFIARLCREKQQLIEEANCLRSQITATSKQVEPEKDSCPKEQGDQREQLSLLEKLQYQLTTQELQYALRRRVCSVNEQPLPGTSAQHPSADEAAGARPQRHKSTDGPENSLGVKPSSSLPRCPLSSEESLQSLKELWEMLDQPLSSSFLSQGDDDLSCRSKCDPVLLLHGAKVPVHPRTAAEASQKMNASKPASSPTKTSKPGRPGRTVKIRNYNVKD